MNLSQFGGIVNDNIYKFTMVFLLINVLGKSQASTILSKTGAVFVIPFLLFSSAAGVLADRFSKKWILASLKILEVCTFLISIPVFYSQNSFGCFTLLFLLATQAAIFGPSKYAIIPELVDKEAVPKANGLITSTTYLGIIIGTFLGSFLSMITGERFILVMIFCIIIAILGLVAAFYVKDTPRQGSTKKFSVLFFVEVHQTIRYCKEYKHLRAVLMGAAFFLLIGAFTQLVMIPYTIDSLGYSKEVGGYLFLCTALGIAVGSVVVGKFLKKKVDLAIPCFCSFVIALLLGALCFFSTNLSCVIVSLVLLGICGGLYTVPLDTFIQVTCPDEKRGQVIGTGNFLGFCGVLLASFALYFFTEVLQFTPAGSFGLMGLLTFFFAFAFCFRLSDVMGLSLANFFMRKEVQLCNVALLTEAKTSPILVLQNANWKKLLVLTKVAPDYHYILSNKMRLIYRMLATLSYHIHMAFPAGSSLLEKARTIQMKRGCACIATTQSIFFDNTNNMLFVEVQFSSEKGIGPSVTFSKIHI